MKNDTLIECQERAQRALDAMPNLMFDGAHLHNPSAGNIMAPGDLVSALYAARGELQALRDLLHAQSPRKSPTRRGADE